MKIALVTPWDEPCGIAAYTRELRESLRPHADITVVPLPHGSRRAETFRKAARACRGADLAHIQHEYILFGGRDPWNARWPVFARALNVPYVVTSHTWLQPFTGGPLWKRLARALRTAVYRGSGWQRRLELGPLTGARAVLVHTQAYREALVARDVDPARVHVVFQGVPGPRPGASAARARSRWRLEGPVVLLFGFLNPAKGHLTALEAWRRAEVRGTLVIAGRPFSPADRPYADQVFQAAAPLGDAVRMTGYLTDDELGDLLAAAQVVLLPYRSGTSSYSLSLALAHGRAVIASDLAPFREIREQRACLDLVPAGNITALAAALRRLAGPDPGARRQLQTEALAWAREHSWDAAAALTADIYRQALQRK